MRIATRLFPRPAPVIPLRQILWWGIPIAGLLVALAQASMIIAGIGYAFFFIPLAWKRKDLALMIIIGSSLFPYDVSANVVPVKFGLGEFSLLLALPVLLLRRSARPINFTRLLPAVLVYFA